MASNQRTNYINALCIEEPELGEYIAKLSNGITGDPSSDSKIERSANITRIIKSSQELSKFILDLEEEFDAQNKCGSNGESGGGSVGNSIYDYNCRSGDSFMNSDPAEDGRILEEYKKKSYEIISNVLAAKRRLEEPIEDTGNIMTYIIQGKKIGFKDGIAEMLKEAAKQDEKIKHITTPTLVSRIKKIVDEMEPI